MSGGGAGDGGRREGDGPGIGVSRQMVADLDAVVSAGLAAAEPSRLVRRALEEGPRGAGEPLILAVGKAARAMARAAARHLEGRHRGGVVLAPVVGPSRGPGAGGGGSCEGDVGPDGLVLLRGGHPLPDAEGRAAARRIAGKAAEASRGRWPILLLLSGGGSALLTLPAHGLDLEDLRTTTRLLLEAGADIGSLNAVRKHLERLKGGRLARMAAPARVRALVLSDVVGDRLDVIASGPVSPDPTTYGDALRVLRTLGVEDGVPSAVLRHLEAGAAGERDETPGPKDPCFRGVEARVVGSVETAARGAMNEAGRLGYHTHLLTTELTGEARYVGRGLGRLARQIGEGDGPVAPPACVVAGGETTVTVTGEGVGGRNQEVALAAATEIDGLRDVLVASVGTDGVDGPTDAAGARVTGTTVERARARGLAPADALSRNDAYPFFRALEDLIVTGPTGTNVMDLQVLLIRP